MDREQFINEVFDFFKKSQDDGLKKTYNLALSTNKQVDWQRLYMYVIRNCESNFLPKPKYFIELFPMFELKEFKKSNYNGYQVRITYKSGRFTDFTIVNWADENLTNIIKRNKNGDAVKRIERFEPHVTLMAHTIYPKDAKAELLYEGV